jgi:hypothetical protein
VKLTQFWQQLMLRLALIGAVLAVCVMWRGLVAPVSAESTAFVRVIDASPGTGSVNVSVNGSNLNTNFQFASVSGYVPVQAGARKIQVVKVAPTGQGAGAAVITRTVSVNAGIPYTVAVLGTKSSGFSLKAFADDNTVASDMAKVRIYHLSPDLGPINVAAGGNTVITGLEYQQASNYLSVAPSSSYTFGVIPTQQANTTMPVTVNLKQGTVTSVFAVGLLNGSPPLQFVTAQVTGVPGMPGTGSDPYAQPPAGNTQQVPLGWLALIVAVVAAAGIGTALISRRLRQSRPR